MTKKIKEIINNILIRLTDITGFDHSSKALKVFDVAESQLEKIIELVVAEERERIVGEIERRVKDPLEAQSFEEGKRISIENLALKSLHLFILDKPLEDK